MAHKYFTNCVGWPEEDVHADGGLIDMIDQAENITRKVFTRNVDRWDLVSLEKALGYAKHPKRGLMMCSDWHVSYHRSELHGRRVYFFKHSAIEYVFTPDGKLKEPNHEDQ